MSLAVNALTVFDDGRGSGPALYAGGRFTSAGATPANRIARWDGEHWSALGTGLDGEVLCLAVFDDGRGAGPALYAGGSFTSAGGAPASRVAKWDGLTWAPLGQGANNAVFTLAAFDLGGAAGPRLCAGGNFTGAGGVVANRIAQWDGSQWSRLGSGMNDSVGSLAVFDDGSGAGLALYAGGSFVTAGGVPANRIARWNGQSWSALGSGLLCSALALCVYDDGQGAGPQLFAGGDFLSAGGVNANRIARWNGQGWSALGSGTSHSVRALTVFDDGSGSGPALHVGGLFPLAGGQVVNSAAKWDGQAWSTLGPGLETYPIGVPPPIPVVAALAVFDDGGGAGPRLYTGGDFQLAGGAAAQNLAAWDGQGWSALDHGPTHPVSALAIFDDRSGSGPMLYAGGSFRSIGGVAAERIARWDGRSWSPLGSGTNGTVSELIVFDDGSASGPGLYVLGNFITAGGVSTGTIARWDEQGWSAPFSPTFEPISEVRRCTPGARSAVQG
jgi:hypothetical protein